MQIQFDDSDFSASAKWIADKFKNKEIAVGSDELNDAVAAQVMCNAITQGSLRVVRVQPVQGQPERASPGREVKPDEPDGQD